MVLMVWACRSVTCNKSHFLARLRSFGESIVWRWRRRRRRRQIHLVNTLASRVLNGSTSDFAGLFFMDSRRTLLFGGVLLKFFVPYFGENDCFLGNFHIVNDLASRGLPRSTIYLAELFFMDSRRTLLFGGVLLKFFEPFWGKNDFFGQFSHCERSSIKGIAPINYIPCRIVPYG